jgi:hypothetical protein
MPPTTASAAYFFLYSATAFPMEANNRQLLPTTPLRVAAVAARQARAGQRTATPGTTACGNRAEASGGEDHCYSGLLFILNCSSTSLHNPFIPLSSSLCCSGLIRAKATAASSILLPSPLINPASPALPQRCKRLLPCCWQGGARAAHRCHG